MYTLGLQRKFTAYHFLIGGDWGDENIKHSHNYQIEILLEKSELDQHGYLVDIVDAELRLDEVVAEFAGKTLNELADFAHLNPSIERLATVMHQRFQSRFSEYGLQSLTVKIWEDDIAWTSFSGPT